MARYSGAGQELWARAFGASESSQCLLTHLAVDAEGPLWAVGSGAYFADHDSAIPSGGPFIATFDGNGSVAWHAPLQSLLGLEWYRATSPISAPLLAPDGHGGVYLARGTALARLDPSSSSRVRWASTLGLPEGDQPGDVVALGASAGDGLYALGWMRTKLGANAMYLVHVDAQGSLQQSVAWEDRFEVTDGYGSEWRGRWRVDTERRSSIHIDDGHVRVAGLYDNDFRGERRPAGVYPSAIILTFDKALKLVASEQWQLAEGYVVAASLAAHSDQARGGVIALEGATSGRIVLGQLEVASAPPEPVAVDATDATNAAPSGDASAVP